MAEDVSVAAAILAAAFVQKNGLKETEAHALWRRMRARMQAEIRKEASGKDASSRSEPAGDAAESAVASGAV